MKNVKINWVISAIVIKIYRVYNACCGNLWTWWVIIKSEAWTPNYIYSINVFMIMFHNNWEWWAFLAPKFTTKYFSIEGLFNYITNTCIELQGSMPTMMRWAMRENKRGYFVSKFWLGKRKRKQDSIIPKFKIVVTLAFSSSALSATSSTWGRCYTTAQKRPWQQTPIALLTEDCHSARKTPQYSQTCG